MKSASIYVGAVATKELEQGAVEVAVASGLSYHGLDQVQITMIQDILVNEFGSDIDDLVQRVRVRMLDAGYDGAVAAGAPADYVASAKGVAKGKK